VPSKSKRELERIKLVFLVGHGVIASLAGCAWHTPSAPRVRSFGSDWYARDLYYL